MTFADLSSEIIIETRELISFRDAEGSLRLSKGNQPALPNAANGSKERPVYWIDGVEVLVTEICRELNCTAQRTSGPEELFSDLKFGFSHKLIVKDLVINGKNSVGYLKTLPNFPDLIELGGSEEALISVGSLVFVAVPDEHVQLNGLPKRAIFVMKAVKLSEKFAFWLSKLVLKNNTEIRFLARRLSSITADIGIAYEISDNEIFISVGMRLSTGDWIRPFVRYDIAGFPIQKFVEVPHSVESLSKLDPVVRGTLLFKSINWLPLLIVLPVKTFVTPFTEARLLNDIYAKLLIEKGSTENEQAFWSNLRAEVGRGTQGAGARMADTVLKFASDWRNEGSELWITGKAGEGCTPQVGPLWPTWISIRLILAPYLGSKIDGILEADDLGELDRCKAEATIKIKNR